MVTCSDAACNRMLRSKWRVKEMKAGKKKKNSFWFCRPKGRPQPRAGCVTHTSYCLNDKYTLPLNDKCTLLLNDKCTLLFNDKYILLLNDKCTLLINDKCTLLINDKYILLLNDKCTLLLNDKYTLLLNDKWPLLFKIKLNSTPTAPQKKEEEERFFHDSVGCATFCPSWLYNWHFWLHVGSPNTWHTASCVDVWHSWPHSRSMVFCHSRLQPPPPPPTFIFFIF